MKLKWIVWIGLPLLVFFLVGSYLYATAASSKKLAIQAQGAIENTLQQAVARTGSLTVSVNGSGELVPAADVSLSFPESGELVALNVKVGEEVNAGDVLAQLEIDQTSAERAAAVASAQLEVVRLQQNLDDLYRNAQMQAAQALVDLEQSQEDLDDLKDIDLQLALAQQAVSDAKEAIEDAEMNLSIVNATPSQEAIDIAYAGLLFREKDLIELQERIKKTERQVKSAPNKSIGDRFREQLLNLQVELAEKQIEYGNAVNKYETMDEPADELDVTLAEAQLRTTQAQLSDAEKHLDNVKSGASTGVITFVEAQLIKAKETWESLSDGPDPDAIALAKAELAKSKAELALVQQGQRVVDLVAPIKGRVVSVDAAAGDRINQNQVITLADLTQPLVQVNVDETDLANVQIGNQAAVIFDALPGNTYTGEVVSINPSLQRAGNSTAVQVLVRLDLRSFPNVLPIGLNASVEIIAGNVENGVLVPLEAVHLTPEGHYLVYVISDGGIETRPVEVGLTDLTTAEIVTGLAPGEVVALNYPGSNEE